ncbi:SDR family oxidoreductase [Oceanobacillus piezotolerans]|uniref:SDR family oxidoreductase n=1 Tax=Oceanobacillus piezotolerans TaxID=2448030 RepID=A0A498DLE4_9BACI|nr:SDR family oxidoreductase [Oceanobacillus piezotolerans]RLL43799.1 SDR family oxidoreductase [Oceanobacillus piezotolerans]
MNHQGKVYVITGAGGGMGSEVASKLLTEGAKVVGIDISLDGMSHISDDNFRKEEANLLDEARVKELFKQVYEEFGKIDGLVNIAGIAQSSMPISDVSLDFWNKVIGINATAVFLTSKEAVSYMKKGGGGSIINVGSVSVARPRPGLQSYIASKGAVEAFSRALAIEGAPDNIRVNVLHPGPAETKMLPQFSSEKQQAGGLSRKDFTQSVPLGNLIQPTDIAEAVHYLLSDGAKMVTGTTLHVDGGRSL